MAKLVKQMYYVFVVCLLLSACLVPEVAVAAFTSTQSDVSQDACSQGPTNLRGAGAKFLASEPSNKLETPESPSDEANGVLLRRNDEPQYYLDSAKKGDRLLGIVRAENQPASVWTSWDQVLASGWTQDKGPFLPLDLGGVLQATGWQKNDFHAYSASYPQPWTGSILPATYLVYVNPIAGVIVVKNAGSSKTPLIDPKSPPGTPTPLNRLSDFAWVAYQDACKGNQQQLSGLRWIIHEAVTNRDCMAVAKYATGLDLGTFQAWPGSMFKMDSLAGQALLGCPDGKGVAWLVAQHATSGLGRKEIDSVAVYGNVRPSGMYPGMGIAFSIQDLKSPNVARRDNNLWNDTRDLAHRSASDSYDRLSHDIGGASARSDFLSDFPKYNNAGQPRWERNETRHGVHSRTVETYKDCVANGDCKLAQLKAQNMQLSSWSSWQQVFQSGWKPYPGPALKFGMVDMLEAMHWREDDFKSYAAQYLQPWKADLEAEYIIWCNKHAGAIIVVWMQAPLKPYLPAGANPPSGVPGVLTKSSDFIFLAYQDACGNDAGCTKNLEWIIHTNVVNDVSALVMDTITHAALHHPPWPGLIYPTETEQGKALVGCPNGYGVLYMLGQYRDRLGPKTVEYAAIFGDANFAFHLVDLA